MRGAIRRLSFDRHLGMKTRIPAKTVNVECSAQSQSSSGTSLPLGSVLAGHVFGTARYSSRFKLPSKGSGRSPCHRVVDFLRAHFAFTTLSLPSHYC
jgi:hypothetical protein